MNEKVQTVENLLRSRRDSLHFDIEYEQRDLARHLSNHRWYAAQSIANHIGIMCGQMLLIDDALGHDDK